MGVPIKSLIGQLVKQYSVRNFIETGTYLGETAYWASSVFQHVITVEYSEDLYKQTYDKFKYIPNIRFIHDDSRLSLKKIIDEINTPSVFWLDNHWCGHWNDDRLSYGENDQCPILGEITLLRDSKTPNFIFIDDAELFLAPPPKHFQLNQWPRIDKIFEIMNAGQWKYFNVVLCNQIIFFPDYAKNLLIDFCREYANLEYNLRVELSKAWHASSLFQRFYLLKQGLQLIFWALQMQPKASLHEKIQSVHQRIQIFRKNKFGFKDKP